MRTLNIQCIATHGSKSMCYSSLPDTPQYSPARQQLDEVDIMMEQMDNMKNPILMGDFNHGPATVAAHFGTWKTTQWLLPFSYGLIVARGMISPYVVHSGQCTYCSFPTVQDHIYISTKAAERVKGVEVIFFAFRHLKYS